MRTLRALLSPLFAYLPSRSDRLPGPGSLSSTTPTTPHAARSSSSKSPSHGRTPSGSGKPWNIPSGRQRAGPGLIAFALACLGLILFFSREMDEWGLEGWELDWDYGYKAAGRGRLPNAWLSAAPVRIVLLVDENTDSIQQVTERILAMTAGPYELSGVFTGTDRETSSTIVQSLVDTYLSTRAPISHHTHPSSSVKHGYIQPGTAARPLLSYHSIIAPTEIHTSNTPHYSDTAHLRHASSVHLSALRSLPSSARHVIVLNANDLIETYGYDRLLLSAITSPVPRSTSTRGEKYKGLIGVSGRAAANVLFSASQQVEMLVDGAGEPGPEDHAGNPGADRVQLRQVAMRAPMIWDMRKVGRVGWWNETLGALGMGDLDLCLRASAKKYACGFYPISTSTQPTWGLVPGTPKFGLELQLSRTDARALDLKRWGQDGRFADGVGEMGSVGVVQPRNGAVRRTIVTAVTASSLPHFLHLHSTLPRSPLTRIVVFVLKTSTPLCSEALDSLSDPELELRYIKDTSHIHLQTYTSPVTAVRVEDGAEVSEQKGEGAEWLGVGLADKIKLLSDVAEEQGGLVLWLDPDREVGNDILKVWEEVAREGVWVGQADEGEGGIATAPADALELLNLTISVPSSEVKAEGTSDTGAISMNLKHPIRSTAVIWPLLRCATSTSCLDSPHSQNQEAALLSALLTAQGVSYDRPSFARAEAHVGSGSTLGGRERLREGEREGRRKGRWAPGLGQFQGIIF